MWIGRRPIGQGVTLRGDEGQIILRPRRVDWDDPAAIFLVREAGHEDKEVCIPLGSLQEIRPNVRISVLRVSWAILKGNSSQVIEFGVTVPDGTAILHREEPPVQVLTSAST